MIKKGFLLVLILFLVSGCTVNYDLVIDNDNIVEDVSIAIPMSEITDDRFEKQAALSKIVYGGEEYVYDKQISNENGNNYINYSYKHDINKYKKSSFLNTCYDSNGIVINNESITISTSNVFKCIVMDDGFRAKKVDVNIKTKLKVKENNADEVNGNTYTWHMNEYEYSAKPIKLVLEKNKSVSEKIDGVEDFGMAAVIVFLAVLGSIIYLFMKIKHKKNSEL